MSTLTTGYNPSYSKNAAILTGNPNRVTVEVEDNIDAYFWKDLLSDLCPHKDFHFNPYFTRPDGDICEKNGNGKSHIMKLSPDFNEWYIGCVDSDYNWLLSDSTQYGQLLTANKYLVQTYAYSIENLLCFSGSLKDFCDNLTEEDVTFDFCDFLKQFSCIVYPLLVWSAYLCGKGIHDFTPRDWGSVLPKTKIDVDMSTIDAASLWHEIESLLLKIKDEVNNRVLDVEAKYGSEIEAKNLFETKLRDEKGVAPENAYLYIRGHDFMISLVNAVVTPGVEFFKQKHFARLKTLSEPQRTERLKQYSARQKKSVAASICQNYRYKHQLEIYDMISRDVGEIWT